MTSIRNIVFSSDGGDRYVGLNRFDEAIDQNSVNPNTDVSTDAFDVLFMIEESLNRRSLSYETHRRQFRSTAKALFRGPLDQYRLGPPSSAATAVTVTWASISWAK